MTDEERLEHERLIAEVQKIRGEGSRSTWWAELLQSGVVAALLTAIVGTVGGGILIARYQGQAHRDELALADRKTRTETQQRIVERALTLLAQGEYHARGRYAITRRPFQINTAASADTDSLRKQRETIIGGGNEFDATWPAQKKTLESLLRQTFPTNKGNKGVAEQWAAATASLDTLISLAQAEYDTYLKNPAVTVDRPPLPEDADAALRASINKFTTAVEQAGQRDDNP